MKERVVVISFSPLSLDLRVLRQIRVAQQAGMETVAVGFRHPTPLPEDLRDVRWLLLDPQRVTLPRKAKRLALLAAARLCPALAERALWQPWLDEALQLLGSEADFDLVVANDLDGLLAASRFCRQRKAGRILFDAHEYFFDVTTGFVEALRKPARKRVITTLAPATAAMITVCQPLADLYARHTGVPCGVIYNAHTSAAEICQKDTGHWDGARPLRLVHHGTGARDRKLEKMIAAVAPCPNMELHFYLANIRPDYERDLRSAAECAPGRIHFHPPVHHDLIRGTLAEYDLGFGLIEPSSESLRLSLPQKFFDCLSAGLGVIIGPSPSMREITDRYRCGVASSSFAVEDLTKTLRELTPETVHAMRAGALRAAAEICYETQSESLLTLYRRLLAPATVPAPGVEEAVLSSA